MLGLHAGWLRAWLAPDPDPARAGGSPSTFGARRASGYALREQLLQLLGVLQERTGSVRDATRQPCAERQ